MKTPSHITAAATSSSPHAATVSAGTPIPWLPMPPPSSSVGSSVVIASAASERWAAALQSVPYLRSIVEGPMRTVYRPPTVIQLSEATGCSVSKLAGAYSDLPVITLSSIVSAEDQEATAAAIAAVSRNSDVFEYLQLSPTDDSMEMAAKALMARRPVPDAEEIFWEADYWEVLRRAKRQAKEEKERLREKKRAQREKKAMMGVSNSSVGVRSPNVCMAATLSSVNLPSFATPHSRQGSLGGPPGDFGDRSPASLHIQTAAQRTAKGLLRRARYNETHNSTQRVHMRSASLLSQSSATQPVIRCRTRPRHDSITSQQTLYGARGFQYPLSSVASDDGRSATSDSFRTLNTHIIRSYQSRDLLGTSLELELSASGGPTNTGTTTRSGPASAEGAKADAAATPEVSPPHNGCRPAAASRDSAKKFPLNTAAAASLVSSTSMPASPNLDACGQQRSSTSCRVPSNTSSPKSRIIYPHSAAHVSLATSISFPLPERLTLQRAPPSPGQGDSGRQRKDSPLPPPLTSATRRPVEKQLARTGREREETSGDSVSQARQTSISPIYRRLGGRSSPAASSAAAEAQPSSRCATARPSSGFNNAAATGSASVRPSASPPGRSSPTTSGAAIAGEVRKAKSPLAPSSQVTQEATATASANGISLFSTAATAKEQRNGGRSVVTRVDSKPLSPKGNAARALPGRRGDGGSAPARAAVRSETLPRTTAVTIALPCATPHPSFSSSAAQTVSVPQRAAVPMRRAPAPQPQLSAGPAVSPTLSIIPTTAAPSTSSSVTPRATAPTLPPSCTLNREVTRSPPLDRVGMAVSAALPTVPQDDADTASSTTSPVTVAPPAETKTPSAVATSRRNDEESFTSRRETTVASRAKGAKGDEIAAQAPKSSTLSKTDEAPARPDNDGADEEAALPPSSPVPPYAADAGRDARGALQNGAAVASPFFRKEVKKKAISCCSVM
ncbi:hypothetical protein GH5_03254 [Leishmania sp. Ghana 2012 LV757]|uniref:hypothetical protein n=1 Tax=Leishmania sp. Ghana 2012 LV757 TaxID=2803181 RepID=UPI001B505594|nr:hypothetical protein GH5_03254 [Leishmania sp. Ghana 2012 LV757]